MNNTSILLGWIWAIFWVYWLVSAFWAKKNIKTSDLKLGIVIRIAIFIFVALVVHARNKQSYSFAPMQQGNVNKFQVITGFLVFLLGIFLAVCARIHLGNNWGMPMTRKKEACLVTNGPYRLVRHPIYSGILLAIFGTALVISLEWLFILLIAGAYFLYSSLIEEKNMTDEFPDVYPAYKEKTKMLIPHVV